MRRKAPKHSAKKGARSGRITSPSFNSMSRRLCKVRFGGAEKCRQEHPDSRYCPKLTPHFFRAASEVEDAPFRPRRRATGDVVIRVDGVDLRVGAEIDHRCDLPLDQAACEQCRAATRDPNKCGEISFATRASLFALDSDRFYGMPTELRQTHNQSLDGLTLTRAKSCAGSHCESGANGIVLRPARGAISMTSSSIAEQYS
jgi:hypothetical protein